MAINRALAIAEIHGARAALDALQEVATDVRLAEPYWVARSVLRRRQANSAVPPARKNSQPYERDRGLWLVLLR